MEEVDLGGIDEEDDSASIPVLGGFGGRGEDELHEYHLFEKDEV